MLDNSLKEVLDDNKVSEALRENRGISDDEWREIADFAGVGK